MAQARPSSTSALRAAKQLVGCFPHARPPEPETYAGAIGATLAKYPAAIVEECVDPRRGLALEREFPPTVKSVADWCDARLAHYDALARYEARPRAPEREFSDDDRALGRQFLADLAAELESRDKAARPSGVTTMGEHIRKALEDRPRQGLSTAQHEEGAA